MFMLLRKEIGVALKHLVKVHLLPSSPCLHTSLGTARSTSGSCSLLAMNHASASTVYSLPPASEFILYMNC